MSGSRGPLSQRSEVAKVVPFKGIIYDTARVSGGDVVAPPYDIITPELREALYRKSPYNIVRIDSGIENAGDNEIENKYQRAAGYLGGWMQEGVFLQSPRPCFYVYEMDYRAEGTRKRLRGFFGLVQLEELGKGVYPHEETHSKPKVDRLRLLSACEANTSPIFSLYHSDEKKASEILKKVVTRPYMEAADPDGAIHRLWVIEGESDIMAITNDLADKAIYIADGHHRYETALEYQKIMREKTGGVIGNEPFNYVLMFLTNIADDDITILPAHRIIRYPGKNIPHQLSGYFETKTIPLEDDIIGVMRGKDQTLGLYQKGEKHYHLLKYKGDGMKETHPAVKGLDVTILHELVLKGLLGGPSVQYEMDPSLAQKMVREGEYDAVFYLNPTKVEDVERVALSSMRMPPKSTYFYPKVMTGFIINSFRNSL